MKALSAEDMRLLDARTIQEEGISGERLMKTAGAALASAILRYIAELSGNGIEVKEIVFLAGKGNNAGDAFVAAKMLYDTHLYKIHLLCMVREYLFFMLRRQDGRCAGGVGNGNSLFTGRGQPR